ncbi:DKNYY domain-containing protein [Flavobacterium procerum]|uniref:DKNYY domain-containing protein n=1 Tax=Flavobacterium procerum TaxID=1455569 RepID=A0ABV6BY37_9FLAO
MIKDLGHHFKIIDNKMILQFDNEVFRKYYKVIDFESFELLQSNDSTHHYFKDKTNVYISSYMCGFAVLENADPASFRILDFEKGFTADDSNYFYFDERLPYDFSKAVILNNHYIKANQKIYSGYTNEIIGVDIESFGIPHPDLIENISKDKNHVYFRNKIIEDADPSSFHFLENCVNNQEYYQECDNAFYAVDANFAWFIRTIAKEVKKIKSKSLSSFHFKVIDEQGYAFDNEYQYYFGKKTKRSS